VCEFKEEEEEEEEEELKDIYLSKESRESAMSDDYDKEQEMMMMDMIGFSGGFGQKKKKKKEEEEEEEKPTAAVVAVAVVDDNSLLETTKQKGKKEEWGNDSGVVVAVSEGRVKAARDLEEEEEELEEEELEENDDADEEYERVPVADEAELGQAHSKCVTTVSCERTGSRLITGSRDGTVKMYDFNGMRADLQPFREIIPQEGYPVHCVEWSASGDMFVCATGSNKAKVFDRDGRERGEFDSGDMYILDAKNTRGHTHNVTKATWNPIEKNLVVTSADDGTARIWNVDYLGDPRGSQRSVIKPTQVKPGRFRATTCAFNADGSVIGMALTDGTIQLFPANSKRGNSIIAAGGNGRSGNAYKSTSVGLVLPPSQQGHLDNTWTYTNKPKSLFKNCHAQDEDITSLCFNQEDGRYQMLSRSCDGTLKVWDLRNANKPLKVFDNLPTSYGETTVSYSPNGSKFFTGCDGDESKQESTGSLQIFDAVKLERVAKIASSEQNVVCALWHARLNQIFVGSGTNDKKLGARGKCNILYDTTLSTVGKGALLAIGRNPRAKNANDIFQRVDVQNILHVPNALPLFQEPVDKSGRKRRLNKIERNDPLISKKPQTDGSGAGARPAQRGSTLLTQHLLRNDGMLSDQDWRLGDARDAILRHAADAEKRGNVHTNTEPNQIWYDSDQDKDDSEDDDEDDDEEENNNSD
jgi:WD repeat-containing protein 70